MDQPVILALSQQLHSLQTQITQLSAYYAHLQQSIFLTNQLHSDSQDLYYPISLQSLQQITQLQNKLQLRRQQLIKKKATNKQLQRQIYQVDIQLMNECRQTEKIAHQKSLKFNIEQIRYHRLSQDTSRLTQKCILEQLFNLKSDHNKNWSLNSDEIIEDNLYKLLPIIQYIFQHGYKPYKRHLVTTIDIENEVLIAKKNISSNKASDFYQISFNQIEEWLPLVLKEINNFKKTVNFDSEPEYDHLAIIDMDKVHSKKGILKEGALSKIITTIKHLLRWLDEFSEL